MSSKFAGSAGFVQLKILGPYHLRHETFCFKYLSSAQQNHRITIRQLYGFFGLMKGEIKCFMSQVICNNISTQKNVPHLHL